MWLFRCCLCRVRKLLDFIKNIFICVPKIFWWVINGKIKVFGWTIPFSMWCCHRIKKIYIFRGLRYILKPPLYKNCACDALKFGLQRPLTGFANRATTTSCLLLWSKSVPLNISQGTERLPYTLQQWKLWPLKTVFFVLVHDWELWINISLK